MPTSNKDSKPTLVTSDPEDSVEDTDGVQETETKATAETEDRTETVEEESKLPPFSPEIVNPGVRTLRIAKVPYVSSTELDLYVKEWGVRNGASMINRVKNIATALKENKVIGQRDEFGEPVKFRFSENFDGIMNTVMTAYNDFAEFVKSSTFTDKACKEPISADIIDNDELGMGDMMLIIRTIFHVNFIEGSLGNALKTMFGLDFSQ